VEPRSEAVLIPVKTLDNATDRKLEPEINVNATKTQQTASSVTISLPSIATTTPTNLPKHSNDPELDELLRMLDEKSAQKLDSKLPLSMAPDSVEEEIEEELESLPSSPNVKKEITEVAYEEDFEEGDTDSSDF
jgi:hypothetical protein